jgi:hypothetical protein
LLGLLHSTAVSGKRVAGTAQRHMPVLCCP